MELILLAIIAGALISTSYTLRQSQHRTDKILRELAWKNIGRHTEHVVTEPIDYAKLQHALTKAIIQAEVEVHNATNA